MKLSLIMATLAAVGALPIEAARANVCINIHDIVSSAPNRDATSIIFKMRDGRVWRNDLQGSCPDLKFNGFAWSLRGTEQVCDSQQSITVIQSGEVCLLGKFTAIGTSGASNH